MIEQLIVFGIVCAAAHWVIARASITEWFWSRATGKLAALLACPACSGWWIAIGCYTFGFRPLEGLHWDWTFVHWTCTGLLGVFLTPVFEAALLGSLKITAIPETETEPDATQVHTGD